MVESDSEAHFNLRNCNEYILYQKVEDSKLIRDNLSQLVKIELYWHAVKIFASFLLKHLNMI